MFSVDDLLKLRPLLVSILDYVQMYMKMFSVGILAVASLSEYNTVSQCTLSNFQPLESKDIAEIIRQFSSKSCSLDTIPSWLFKRNLDTLLSPITRIVNTSFTTGIFPSTVRESIITPVIKKSNADRNALKETVSDKKNLQITLEIKKHTFQSQHVPFFLKKLLNFDTKATFYRISFRGYWALFLSTGKFP